MAFCAANQSQCPLVLAWMAVGLLALTSTSLPAEAQVTVRASVAANGDEGNGLSFLPAISPDGRNVSFTSAANNLLAPPKQDTNGMRDVFVHDRNTGEITRVSVSSDGEQANGHSGSSSIFADGRFIAFASTATNLVPDDTNGANDVFLHDRKTGQTTRVSVSSSGEQGNAASHTPAISADGRYVAFESAANNLVPGDTNTVWDIFVHDRISGETSRVSVSSSGGQSDADSRFASISADGRYVAFTSDAHNLVSGPSNFRTDVYVHDRQTGQTERVSVSSSGELGNDNSLHNDISADGRYVAFSSFATNLHPNDQTASEDVFVHDRVTGETTLESISTSGQQANSWSFWPAISANGRFVSFVSDASNLVPGDTNGRRDVFLRDRMKGTTTRVSVASDGTQGDDNSGFFSGPSISDDGEHVAFASNASNLVPDDTNNASDVFIHGLEWSPDPSGDLNGDGVVDGADLLILLSAWGKCNEPDSCPADLNNDGTVDGADLLILLSNWG
jgi:Tol biopolymer transport system component